MLKFVIWSPEYTEGIGGVIALHLLAKNLAEEGYPVVISTRTTMRNSKALTIDRIDELTLNPDETVVIYPEIVIGNPFNAKHVVRWLLNTPGKCGGDGVYGKHDLVYKYWDYFEAPDESAVKGHLRMISGKLDIFHDKGMQRSGECFLVKKGLGKVLDKHAPDSINIDRFISDEYLADLFNRSERFISYDSMSYHSIQAALCGCVSVIIPDDGVTKEEFMKKVPLTRYGVAYGMDDIDHAVRTIHLLRQEVQRTEDEGLDMMRAFIRDCERYVAVRNEMPESREVIDVVIASNGSDIDSYKNVARCINSLVVSAHDDVAFNIIVAESSTDICFDAATANAAPHRCTTVYPGVPFSTTEYQRFGAMFAHADTIVVCSPSYRFTFDWVRSALQTLQSKPNDPLSVSGPAPTAMSTSDVFRMAFGVSETSGSGHDECVMYRRSVWEQTVLPVNQDRLSTEETRPQAIEELFTTEAQVIL